MTKAIVPPVTILLVDDRPENLVALEALLRRDGLEIVTASSGREALEILLLRDVGLAIIDVQMPEMDGFELAELMRGTERSRAIPIIFVTAGMHDAQRVFDGYDAGAVDFLHKPIEPRILRNKTETFVNLCRQRMELAETLRFHEIFVAAVVHDLRNPLNAINMAGQVLFAAAPDARQRDVASRLVRSATRMALMIDQLFDLSRSRLRGGIPIEREIADLAPAVRSVVEELRATTSAEIELVETGQSVGHWDVPRMARVVSNLISNAAGHGQEGAKISVTLSSDDGGVTLTVHNAGVIKAEIMDTLFEPFAARPHLPGKKGLGLGLYIVHQIVQAHGGAVDIQSSEAEGTTVSIHVPKPRYERPRTP